MTKFCIHANAGSTSAFGSETYVLGLHRTESQQNIADRENSTIYLEEDKGVKYNSFDLSPDAIIARQLQLSVFLDHSINFATKIQSEFKKIGRYDRGVKQAGFLVLYKTTMPSVLIETGFLSNLKDETYLKEDASQMQMANAMFLAFKKYKEELEGIDEKKNSINKRSVQTVDSGINKLETTLVDSSCKDKIIFKVQLESSLKQLIKDKKFDGISFYENNPDEKDAQGNDLVTPAWMVFEPNQIKSAHSNVLFSMDSKDIRYKLGGEL